MIFLEPEKTIKVGKNLFLNFTFKHQNPVLYSNTLMNDRTVYLVTWQIVFQAKLILVPAPHIQSRVF